MADRPTIQLSPRWRIGDDGLQWLIQKRGGGAKESWSTVGYIATERQYLLRTMFENGAEAYEMEAAIIALPERHQKEPRQPERREPTTTEPTPVLEAI